MSDVEISIDKSVRISVKSDRERRSYLRKFSLTTLPNTSKGSL